MATTPNQKPVPSEDYTNMRFNAGKLDEFMTSTASSYVDRLGVTHLTVKGIQQSVTGALIPANNLSDVQSAATSRTNLGATTIGSQLFTATSAANARTAILAAARGANSDITSLLGITSSVISTDANTIAATGWYSLGSGAANIPVAAVSLIAHINSTVNTAVQSCYIPSSNIVYTRGLSSGVWGSWRISAGGGANSDITSLTGVTNASAAASGVIGEVLSNTGTLTAITTGAIQNTATLVLSPGDWDVRGVINIESSSASFTSITAGISSTTATINVFPNRTQIVTAFSAAGQHVPAPSRRFNVSVSTTIYLAASCAFASGTAQAQGYLEARRMR